MFIHLTAYSASVLEYLKGISMSNTELMSFLPVLLNLLKRATQILVSVRAKIKSWRHSDLLSFSHTPQRIDQGMVLSSLSVHLESDHVSLCLLLLLPWSKLPSSLLIPMIMALWRGGSETGPHLKIIQWVTYEVKNKMPWNLQRKSCCRATGGGGHIHVKAL